jgi:hypothetical protein
MLMSHTLATLPGGGEIVEIIGRKSGEIFPSGENLETLVSGHGETEDSVEETWRFPAIKDTDDSASVSLIVCAG